MKFFMKSSLMILIMLAFVSGAASPERGKGIGIIVGEPTGLSAKMWTSSATAIDGGLAWSFGRNGHLHFHADQLWHNFNFINNTQFALYFGAGAELNLGSLPAVGVRGVVGIDYFFRKIPLDAFFEIVPVFTLLPGTGFAGGAGLGLRWFF